MIIMLKDYNIYKHLRKDDQPNQPMRFTWAKHKSQMDLNGAKDPTGSNRIQWILVLVILIQDIQVATEAFPIGSELIVLEAGHLWCNTQCVALGCCAFTFEAAIMRAAEDTSSCR